LQLNSKTKKKLHCITTFYRQIEKVFFYNNITVNLFELPKIYKSIFVNVKCFSIELFIQVITPKVLSLTVEALNEFFPFGTQNRYFHSQLC
jgi:hypothetical protein